MLRRYRDVGAALLLLPMKDPHRVDKEDVLVVGVDVERIVVEHVREHGGVRIRLCERRSDGHSLAVVVDDILLVARERGSSDTALAKRLVDDVEDEREVIHVTGALDTRR